MKCPSWIKALLGFLATIAAAVLTGAAVKRWKAIIGEIPGTGAPFWQAEGDPHAIKFMTTAGVKEADLPKEALASEVVAVAVVSNGVVKVAVKHEVKDRRGLIGGGP